MKQGKIPTIIGILILVIGLGIGIYLVQTKKIFKLGAEVDNFPKDVRVTNVSDSSFTVSWTTDKEVTGFISWGETDSKMDKVEEDEIGKKSFTHYVTVMGLTSSTNYYFKINSGNQYYDNNGVPWNVATGDPLPPSTSLNVMSGNILSSTGEPAANVLVYISVGGASPLSNISSENGSWVINISSLRGNDLKSYFSLNETDDVIEISANAGPQGTSSAQIYLISAKPVPPMILGTTHNFRNLPESETGELLQASLQLPEEATQTSKFKTDEKIDTTPKTVSLTSIKEGEVVNSTNPEFFGKGPPGTNITIKVESDTISANVKVESSGNWNWSPPNNLAPGIHKITISWKDSLGVVKTITKTFIVQAAEVPAFEATPSATPTNTPKPTATSTPKSTSTPSPTPRLTATPSGSPSATVTSTPKSTSTPSPTPIQPESGVGFPTIILISVALLFVGICAFGLYPYFK